VHSGAAPNQPTTAQFTNRVIRARIEQSGRAPKAARINHLDVRVGYHDRLDIQAMLRKATSQRLLAPDIDLSEPAYFLTREVVVSSPAPTVPRWRKQLYLFLSRNAAVGCAAESAGDRGGEFAQQVGQASGVGRGQPGQRFALHRQPGRDGLVDQLPARQGELCAQ
jgi:hypothetical protein